MSLARPLERVHNTPPDEHASVWSWRLWAFGSRTLVPWRHGRTALYAAPGYVIVPVGTPKLARVFSSTISLANRLTRLSGRRRSRTSSWSVGSIWGKSGPPSPNCRFSKAQLEHPNRRSNHCSFGLSSRTSISPLKSARATAYRGWFLLLRRLVARSSCIEHASAETAAEGWQVRCCDLTRRDAEVFGGVDLVLLTSDRESAHTPFSYRMTI